MGLREVQSCQPCLLLFRLELKIEEEILAHAPIC